MSNTRIAVLCPSRARPDLLARFWRSAKHPLADIAVYVERDDPHFREYLGLGLPINVGRARSYGQKLNFLASTMHDYAAYFTAEDDYICTNPAWAQIYLDALPRGVVGLAADECEPEWWPHTAAMSGEWVRRMGGLHPEVVQHYHLTEVWRDIAELAGCAVRLTEACWQHEAAQGDRGADNVADHGALMRWRTAGGVEVAAERLRGSSEYQMDGSGVETAVHGCPTRSNTSITRDYPVAARSTP